MRIGRVIGKVVLSQSTYTTRAGSFLVVSPMGKDELSNIETSIISTLPSLIVYDEIGAGIDQIIAFTEGGEATRPFDKPTPVDAYNNCIIDTLNYEAAN